MESHERVRLQDANHCVSFRFLFVPCCFFLSGAAGLIYQVLWVRMIDKVIGSAPFAVAMVLSVFMGGLALGSYLAGRYIDRTTSRKFLLSLYGKLEVCIGVYGLVFPFLIGAVRPLYQSAYDLLFPYFWFYQFFTFVGCLLLLVIPTSLMGATLPVLCRFYVAHLDHMGTRTGALYGLNTLGAAVGAILCGFVLIGNLGVWATLFVAAGINFLVGAACILTARQEKPLVCGAPAINHSKEPFERAQSSDQASDANRQRIITKWALWLFAVSGFCGMAYEVIWTRLLGLVIGPTTYSFTLVVSTFIIGLAAGSIVFGRLGDRVKKVFLLLVLTQLCASGLALAVSQFLGNSQFLFAKLIHTFQDDFDTMMLVQSIILFAVLVGPTIFLGATFPLVSRIYARSVPAIGRSIGSAYALNTVGAILGSFAAGFVLIPWVGKDGGLWLVIAFQFMVAFLALMQPEVGSQKKRWRRRRLVGMLSAVLGVICLSYYPSWNRSVLSRGWYRNFQDIENALDRTSWWDALLRGSALLAQQRQGIELAFYGDGIGGFTTVEKETTSLGRVEYALYNSGKPDASSHGDRSTQTLSGHIPLLFHPDPEKVMVLGLASGMTPGEVLLYPVKQLDVLEINEQVVNACRSFFTPWNNACLSDQRTRLIVQDGRNHLALTREKYDVIISEPSNPWMAGLANLYTLDFFRLVRGRLKDKGVFAQWIQSYEMDWDTFSLLGRTFAEVFPEAAMFKVGPVDYLLLGFAGQQGLEWEVAERNIKYARRSTNVSFSGASFLVHLLMTEDLKGLFGTGPVHTDNRPHLEFAAPTKLYAATLDLDRIVEPKRRLSPQTKRVLAANSDPETFLDLIEFAGSANVPLFSMLHPGTLTPSQKGRYFEVVKRFCSQALVPSYHVFAEAESKKACAEIHVAKIEQKLAQGNPRAQDHYNRGLALIAADRRDEAPEAFRGTVSLDPFHERAHTALGLLLAETGRLQEAIACFYRAVELAPLNAEVHRNLAMAEARLGNLDKASTHLHEALAISPHDVVTLNELGSVLLGQGKVGEAVDRYSAALSLVPDHAESHHNLGMALFKQGKPEEALKHFSEALRISPDNANVRYNIERVSRLLDQSGKARSDSR